MVFGVACQQKGQQKDCRLGLRLASRAATESVLSLRPRQVAFTTAVQDQALLTSIVPCVHLLPETRPNCFPLKVL